MSSHRYVGFTSMLERLVDRFERESADKSLIRLRLIFYPVYIVSAVVLERVEKELNDLETFVLRAIAELRLNEARTISEVMAIPETFVSSILEKFAALKIVRKTETKTARKYRATKIGKAALETGSVLAYEKNPLTFYVDGRRMTLLSKKYYNQTDHAILPSEATLEFGELLFFRPFNPARVQDLIQTEQKRQEAGIESSVVKIEEMNYTLGCHPEYVAIVKDKTNGSQLELVLDACSGQNSDFLFDLYSRTDLSFLFDSMKTNMKPDTFKGMVSKILRTNIDETDIHFDEDGNLTVLLRYDQVKEDYHRIFTMPYKNLGSTGRILRVFPKHEYQAREVFCRGLVEYIIFRKEHGLEVREEDLQDYARKLRLRLTRNHPSTLDLAYPSYLEIEKTARKLGETEMAAFLRSLRSRKLSKLLESSQDIAVSGDEEKTRRIAKKTAQFIVENPCISLSMDELQNLLVLHNLGFILEYRSKFIGFMYDVFSQSFELAADGDKSTSSMEKPCTVLNWIFHLIANKWNRRTATEYCQGLCDTASKMFKNMIFETGQTGKYIRLNTKEQFEIAYSLYATEMKLHGVAAPSRTDIQKVCEEYLWKITNRVEADKVARKIDQIFGPFN